MVDQKTTDLYVKAIDFAKEQKDVSEQGNIILNRFKIIMLGGSVENANKEFEITGKVKRSTLHNIRNLAESVYEDCVRNLGVDKETCDRILREGKLRADICEKTMLKDLEANSLLVFA
ncbi:MAG: hypothetical protein IJR53_08610 [Bacteroidales bacterium]|nr:hypothetical protein [Bacteroidales bacterium]